MVEDDVEVNSLTINYIPMNKKGAVCKIHFSPEIDDTFCNVDKVKMYSLNSNELFVFTILLKTNDIGKNNFKGYIEEHLFEDPNKDGMINHKTKRTYIDIPLK